MEPGLLAECVGSAKERGWNGGAMAWQVSSDIVMSLGFEVDADEPSSSTPMRRLSGSALFDLSRGRSRRWQKTTIYR